MVGWKRLAMAVCGAALLSVGAGAQQGGERIGGKVVSARDGHPLPRAVVTLWSFQTRQTVQTTETDSEGRFRFDPVAAGKYRMTGMATNYATAAYMAHEGYATAIVTGAGLATGSLELRLTPVATISGRVFDGAEPVQRANVMLYREEPGAKGKATKEYSGQTDDEGAFEIGRLAEGTYYLSVSGTPWYAVQPPMEAENAQMPYRESVDPALEVAYPMVFYPDALDPAEAVPIVIHGGERFRANMQMHPEHAVTLTMRLTPGETQNRPFEMLTRTVFGVEEPVQVQMSQMNGVREFAGLAPGEYNLRQMTMNGMTGQSTPVDVRTGAAAVDEAAPGDGASLTVTVHAADGETLPDALTVGLRRDGGGRTSSAKVSETGVAEMAAAPAGSYRLAVSGGGRTLHVMSMKVDGKVVGDGRLTLADGEHVAVDATVSAAVMSVEGFVHRDGKAVAGVFVVLVPAGSDVGEELFRRDQSDLDGSFEFKNVAPGNYIVFASDNVEALHWTDAETLMPHLLQGVPVAVKANDGAVIHLNGPVNLATR